MALEKARETKKKREKIVGPEWDAKAKTTKEQSYTQNLHIKCYCRRKFKVRLPAIWTDEKQRWEVREEKTRRKKIREEKESEERR